MAVIYSALLLLGISVDPVLVLFALLALSSATPPSFHPTFLFPHVVES